MTENLQNMTEETQFWGIIEIMGHRKLGGLITDGARNPIAPVQPWEMALPPALEEASIAVDKCDDDREPNFRGSAR
jgi:hypothetical protein